MTRRVADNSKNIVGQHLLTSQFGQQLIIIVVLHRLRGKSTHSEHAQRIGMHQLRTRRLPDNAEQGDIVPIDIRRHQGSFRFERTFNQRTCRSMVRDDECQNYLKNCDYLLH